MTGQTSNTSQGECAPPARTFAGQRASDYIWLAYSVFFFIDPILRKNIRFWIETAVVYAVFLAVYVTYVNARATRVRYWLLGAFYVLGLLSFPSNSGATSFFIFSAAFLPFAVHRVATVRLVLVAECFGVVAERFLIPGNMNSISVVATVFFIAVVGSANTFIAEQKRAASRLRLANEEIEQLAALAERERIARDLHDVLGHTLSVIVLKAELAGRLLATGADPARAAAEMSDVERTARTALAEVREAIGGYRAKGMPAELELARNTLSAAGVGLTCDTPVPRLAAAEETVMSLVVREAVTNIVRHARARQCSVSFGRADDGFVALTIQDDGVGMDGAHALLSGGNGLRGMRERVETMGGRFAVLSDGGGTAVLAELPIATRALSDARDRSGLVQA